MSVPPLPDTIPVTLPANPNSGNGNTQEVALLSLDSRIHWPPWQFPFYTLREGAWLINFKATWGFRGALYDGTLRIQRQANTLYTTSSGDLYYRPDRVIQGPLGHNISIPGQGPKASDGIPIFPIKNYRYYLRVTKVPPVFILADSFTLRFEMWSFDITENKFGKTPDGSYSAEMKFVTAPAGYPSSNDYLVGDVKNVSTGTVAGRLGMGWVSEKFRKVTIEIDTCTDCEAPLRNDAGWGWKDVLNEVGFDVTVVQSETNIPDPPGSGGVWTLAELHQAMLDHRDKIDLIRGKVDLDNEWRYHVLAVPSIDLHDLDQGVNFPFAVRGIMYDNDATDSNKLPREGVAMSAKWIFPEKGTPIDPSKPAGPKNQQPDWGFDIGKEFGKATDGYFRAAVHEIGHAMGLLHNNDYEPPDGEPIDCTFMCPSDSIAEAAKYPLRYPLNIVWAFSEKSLKRLRHYDDLHVRPGGLNILTKHAAITPHLDAETVIPGLKLDVEPLLEEVPLGAPVRLNLKLTNTGDFAVYTLADISLKSPSVHGFVKDPSGMARTFRPLIHCLDYSRTTILGPGKSVTSCMTLLRGAEGALFQSSGVCNIVVKASWAGDDSKFAVQGQTTVFVTGTTSASHAAAAHKILTTPDALLVLVLGGDHLKEGVEAIQQAVQDETLGPHFATIEAKRLARPFNGRRAEYERAKKVLGDGAVMSEAERVKLERLLKAGSGKGSNSALAESGNDMEKV